MEEPGKRSFTVIIDSNFLFIPLKFGVDIFEELGRLLGSHVKCVVTSPVLKELQHLRNDAGPSLSRRIEFALTLAERFEKVDVHTEPDETVDDSIVRTATLLRCPVATNDSELRRRLRREGIPVIYLRKRAYLEMEGAT